MAQNSINYVHISSDVLYMMSTQFFIAILCNQYFLSYEISGIWSSISLHDFSPEI